MLGLGMKRQALLVAFVFAGCGQYDQYEEDEIVDDMDVFESETANAPDSIEGTEALDQEASSDDEQIEGSAAIEPSGDPQDGERAQEPVSVDDIGVLALLNDRDATDVELLDVECAIRSDAARNIIDFLDGDDGEPWTADDKRFETIDQVRDVQRVGYWTIELLAQCAERLGYVPEVDEGAMLVMLNDAEVIDLYALDGICDVRSDSARNLIGHRDGDDGVPGTADDNPFDTVDEVYDVHMVGDWTVEQLITCAHRLRYEVEVSDSQSAS